MTSPLLQVLDPNPIEGLNFDPIYLNGLQVLRRIKLKNLSNQLIKVKLGSTLRDQITFQLRNENLSADEGLDVIVKDRPVYYNEIFNHVDPINFLTMEPYETQNLVMGYLPELESRIASEIVSDPLALLEFDKEIVDKNVFFDGYGTVSFKAVKINSNQQEEGEEQVIEVGLKSRVCKSVLESDITNTDISFGSCKVNGIYVREFTIYNLSEIELEYCINFIGSGNTKWSKFFEFVSLPNSINSSKGIVNKFDELKIRMSFQPDIDCELNLDLQIVNLNDPSNFVECHLYAVVGELDDMESIALSTSTHLLDYGDCYGGVWIDKPLTLRNLCDAHLEIKLSTTNPNVKFSLANEDAKVRRPKELDLSESNSIPPSEPTSAFNSKLHSPTNSKFRDLDLDSRIGSEINDQDIASRGTSFKGRQDMDNSSENGTDMDSSLGFSYTTKDKLNGNIVYIDELILKPGSERSVKVHYRPSPDVSSTDFNAGKLLRTSFQVQLLYFKLENSGTGWPGSPTFLERSQRIKLIQCKARCATSFIEILPAKLDFGDCNVGMLKTLPLFIANHSDLPTMVELRYASKVISCAKGPFTISPNSSIEIRIDLFPRKINPSYKKQIVIANLNNNDNDQILEVNSNHIDKNRVSFHSLFYKIHTPTGANFLDLNSIIVNSPKISNFVIENISARDLKLELATTRPDEIYFFKVNEDSPTPEDMSNNIPDSSGGLSGGNNGSLNRSGADLRESILDKMDDESRIQKKVGTKPATNPRAVALQKGETNRTVRSHSFSKTTTYLDLADGSGTKGNHLNNTSSEALDYFNPQLSQPMKQSPSFSKVKLESTPLPSPTTVLGLLKRSNSGKLQKNPISSTFLKLEESMSQPLPALANIMAEEEYAIHVIQRRKDVETLIKDQVIVPLKKLVIKPKQRFHVIIFFMAQRHTIPNLQGIPRTFNAKILIKLLQFDRTISDSSFQSLLKADLAHIPVRELMIRCLISKSMMDLGQRNFNFGLIDKDDIRSKVVIIRNLSEQPLIFMMRKSGSIASGDLYFEGSKYGVVRGFGKKHVTLTFSPSLPGQFGEAVIVRNIMDPDNDQILQVKADIRKPSTFSVQSLAEDFGPCYIDELCPKPRIITISNTHKHIKVFEVRVDHVEMNFGWCLGELYFYLNDDKEMGNSILSSEQEQQIETLEQKLKIAVRKGRYDKVKKIEDKLTRLRNGEAELPGHNDEDEPDEPLTTIPLPEPIQTKSLPGYGEVGYVQTTPNSVVFTIPGTSRLAVKVYFKPIATSGLMELMSKKMIHMNKEMVSGQILVHEHRNRDACKRVIFQATVLYDRICRN